MSQDGTDVDATAVEEPAGSEGLVCGSCGTQAAPGARKCPECGHGLMRTCFCGLKLAANQQTCPKCGADWSQSMRASHRSRTHKPRKSEALRYALIGVASAAAAAILFYLVVSLLALAAPGEGALSAGALERLALARAGIAALGRGATQGLAANAAVILGVLLIVLVGALGGLVAYLLQVGRRRHRPQRDGTRREHRRRR